MKTSFPSLLAAALAISTFPARAQSAAPQGPLDAGFELLKLHLGDEPQDKESEVKVTLNGFARVEYGAGSRFGAASGKDQLGIAKMALKTTAKYEDFDFIAVLGATLLSDQPVDTTYKDLFVVWHNVGGSEATVKVGAQPILFGLKPEGYPGDRTIVPSVEFGGAGGFAVSNQAGPSLLAEYPLMDKGNLVLQAGLFDTAAIAPAAPGTSLDGSRLYRNYFGQLRAKDLGIEGMKALVGFEGRYVGGTDDSVEPIFDAGIGYGNKEFDASIEYISLDKNITGTTADENYLVVEVTSYLNDRWTAMVDYAVSDELDATTVRLGAKCEVNKHVTLHVEYSHDILDNAPDLESGNIRMTFHF